MFFKKGLFNSFFPRQLFTDKYIHDGGLNLSTLMTQHLSSLYLSFTYNILLFLKGFLFR